MQLYAYCKATQVHRSTSLTIESSIGLLFSRLPLQICQSVRFDYLVRCTLLTKQSASRLNVAYSRPSGHWALDKLDFRLASGCPKYPTEARPGTDLSKLGQTARLRGQILSRNPWVWVTLCYIPLHNPAGEITAGILSFQLELGSLMQPSIPAQPACVSKGLERSRCMSRSWMALRVKYLVSLQPLI